MTDPLVLPPAPTYPPVPTTAAASGTSISPALLIIGIVSIILIAVVAILTVSIIRRSEDNGPIFTIIGSMSVPCILAFVAILNGIATKAQSEMNSAKLDVVHTLTNARSAAQDAKLAAQDAKLSSALALIGELKEGRSAPAPAATPVVLASPSALSLQQAGQIATLEARLAALQVHAVPVAALPNGLPSGTAQGVSAGLDAAAQGLGEAAQAAAADLEPAQ